MMDDTVVPPAFDEFFGRIVSRKLVQQFFNKMEPRLEVDWKNLELKDCPAAIAKAYEKICNIKSWQRVCTTLTELYLVSTANLKNADQLNQYLVKGHRLEEANEDMNELIPWPVEPMVMWIYLNWPQLWNTLYQRAYAQSVANSGVRYYFKPIENFPEFKSVKKDFESDFGDFMRSSRGKKVRIKISETNVGTYKRYIIRNDPYPRWEEYLKDENDEEVENRIARAMERFSIVLLPQQSVIRVVSDFLTQTQQKAAALSFIQKVLHSEPAEKPLERYDLAKFNRELLPLQSKDPRFVKGVICGLKYSRTLADGKKITSEHKCEDGDVYAALLEQGEFSKSQLKHRKILKVLFSLTIHTGPEPDKGPTLFGADEHVTPWPEQTFKISYTDRKCSCRTADPMDLEALHNLCAEFGIVNLSSK